MNSSVDSELTLSILKYMQMSWKKYIVDDFDVPYN